MLHEKIGQQLDSMGGYLKCNTCGREKSLSGTADYMRTGWPKCCGYTMTWITQRMIEQSAYGTDCKGGECE